MSAAHICSQLLLWVHHVVQMVLGWLTPGMFQIRVLSYLPASAGASQQLHVHTVTTVADPWAKLERCSLVFPQTEIILPFDQSVLIIGAHHFLLFSVIIHLSACHCCTQSFITWFPLHSSYTISAALSNLSIAQWESDLQNLFLFPSIF